MCHCLHPCLPVQPRHAAPDDQGQIQLSRARAPGSSGKEKRLVGLKSNYVQRGRHGLGSKHSTVSTCRATNDTHSLHLGRAVRCAEGCALDLGAETGLSCVLVTSLPSRAMAHTSFPHLSDLAQSLLLGDDAYWPGAAEAPPWDSPRLTPSHRRKMNAQVLWPCTRRALFLRTQAAYLHLSAGADTEQAANTR